MKVVSGAKYMSSEDHPEASSSPAIGRPEIRSEQCLHEVVRYLRLDQTCGLTSSSVESWADLLRPPHITPGVCGRHPRASQSPPRSVNPVAEPTTAKSSARLVEAAEAARICGISRTLWYTLKAAGRVPTPVHLGRRVLWRVDELHRWMDAGCPALHQWKHMDTKMAGGRARGSER